MNKITALLIKILFVLFIISLLVIAFLLGRKSAARRKSAVIDFNAQEIEKEDKTLQGESFSFIRDYVKVLYLFRQASDERDRYKNLRDNAAEQSLEQTKSDYAFHMTVIKNYYFEARALLEPYVDSKIAQIEKIASPISATLYEMVETAQQLINNFDSPQTPAMIGKYGGHFYVLIDKVLSHEMQMSRVIWVEKIIDNKQIYECKFTLNQLELILSDINYCFGDELSELREGILKDKTYKEISKMNLKYYIHPVLALEEDAFQEFLGQDSLLNE